jgi:hypothetical protein
MFVKTQKLERGSLLEVKIHVSFRGENSRTVALWQLKIRTVKDYGHIFKFYLNLFCLTTVLCMTMLRNFEVMLEQTLNHCV